MKDFVDQFAEIEEAAQDLEQRFYEENQEKCPVCGEMTFIDELDPCCRRCRSEFTYD